MMRTMLSGANLSSTYWSWAIRHAVYVKNRLPHASLPNNHTPFQGYTGRRPDLSSLRVFGSYGTVKHPRDRRYKIDQEHTTTGTFLGFSATDRNIIFEDGTTGEEKTARHVIFDEAFFSVNNRPPYAQQLMDISEEQMTQPSQLQHKTQKSPKPTKTSQPIHNLNIVPPESSNLSEILPVTTPHISPNTHLIPDDPLTNIIHAVNNIPLSSEFDLSSNPFGPSLNITIKVKGTHPTLGLISSIDNDTSSLILESMAPSTPAHRIPRWKSTLRQSTIIAVDDNPVHNNDELMQCILNARKLGLKQVSLTFIPREKVSIHPDTCIPQLQFDQVDIMSYQHHAARNNTAPWSDPHTLPPISEGAIHSAMNRGHLKPRLTRAFLRKQTD